MTSRSGTPSQKPMPSGRPMLLQVMIFGMLTACFSASVISPAQSSALPLALVSGFSTTASVAASGITLKRQVSCVSPTCFFLSSGSLWGSGLPRDTSPKSFCAVRYSSRLSASSQALAQSGDKSLPSADLIDNPAASAPLRPRNQRRVSRRCSARNSLESNMLFRLVAPDVPAGIDIHPMPCRQIPMVVILGARVVAPVAELGVVFLVLRDGDDAQEIAIFAFDRRLAERVAFFYFHRMGLRIASNGDHRKQSKRHDNEPTIHTRLLQRIVADMTVACQAIRRSNRIALSHRSNFSCRAVLFRPSPACSQPHRSPPMDRPSSTAPAKKSLQRTGRSPRAPGNSTGWRSTMPCQKS